MIRSLWFLDSSPRSYEPHAQAQSVGDQASKPNALPHRDPGQTEPATPGGPKRLLHRAVSHHCCGSLPPLPQHPGFRRALLQEGQTEAWRPQALQPPAEHDQRPGSHSGGGDHVLADEAALGPGPRLQGRLLAPPRHGSEDCLPSRLHTSHEALARRHPSHDPKHHHHDPKHHQWTHLAPLLQHLPQQWAKQHPAPPTLTLHHPSIAPPPRSWAQNFLLRQLQPRLEPIQTNAEVSGAGTSAGIFQTAVELRCGHERRQYQRKHRLAFVRCWSTRSKQTSCKPTFLYYKKEGIWSTNMESKKKNNISRSTRRSLFFFFVSCFFLVLRQIQSSKLFFFFFLTTDNGLWVLLTNDSLKELFGGKKRIKNGASDICQHWAEWNSGWKKGEIQIFSGIALQTWFWHVLTSKMKGKYVKGFQSLWKKGNCAHKGTM